MYFFMFFFNKSNVQNRWVQTFFVALLGDSQNTRLFQKIKYEKFICSKVFEKYRIC